MIVPADSVKTKTGKIAELFVYDNFNRVPAERVEAGDICAFTGLSDVGIGETVCARDAPNALPTIEVSSTTAYNHLRWLLLQSCEPVMLGRWLDAGQTELYSTPSKLRQL